MSAPENFPKAYPSELAESIGETITEALQQDRIAGPEDLFRQGVIAAVGKLLSEHETSIEDDLEELIHLYGRASSLVPTAERPFRARTRSYCGRGSRDTTSYATIHCFRTSCRPSRSRRRSAILATARFFQSTSART